ncbi:hypothetical protein ACODYM_28810 [Burkholderia gladioli]|uniref:hypothetical protein n=1 Tax=Burkholderia gladioli TaxID=28095 RepID=UPI003B506C4E
MNDSMRNPNFELLRDAFEIIDGIPSRALKLSNWRTKGEMPECGTIACAAGWLAMHPKFNALGFTADEHTGAPWFKGHSCFYAAQLLLGLDGESDRIFSSRHHGYKDHELGQSIRKLSEKQLWKRRVLRLFQDYNQPFDPKVGKGLMLDVRAGAAA